MKSKNTEQTPARITGIYLLPNLFTTAALFAGFYSIIAALKGDFDIAAVAIFVAMVADGLDGRVARLTNTQTAFGAQYDSLSDMVAFGVAPALIIYSWSLVYLGKLGWLVAFLYTAATALRLARFNTQVAEDKQYSQGLACTAAAPVVAGMVWLGGIYHVTGTYIAIPAAILTLLAAACMVSRFRYYTFKQIDFRGKVPFFAVVIIVLIVAAIALDPPQMLFDIFLVYMFSGPVMTLWKLRETKKERGKNNRTKGRR